MAKPSSNYSTSKLESSDTSDNMGMEIPQVQIDMESNPLYTKVTNKVLLRSLYDARLEYRGQVSGQLYIWNSAGSVIEVIVEDSEVLLAKRLGSNSCCGSSKDGTRIFEIAN